MVMMAEVKALDWVSRGRVRWKVMDDLRALGAARGGLDLGLHAAGHDGSVADGHLPLALGLLVDTVLRNARGASPGGEHGCECVVLSWSWIRNGESGLDEVGRRAPL